MALYNVLKTRSQQIYRPKNMEVCSALTDTELHVHVNCKNITAGPGATITTDL